MTDQQKKQKAIAVAFAEHILHHLGIEHEILMLNPFDRYVEWTATEEGKRLTAEEAEKESSYELLLKISKQFDRFEGRLKGSLFGE